MRFNSIVLLLSCNYCLSDSFKSSGSNNVSDESFNLSGPNGTANIDRKTTFTDLVNDVKFLILRELDFVDLITMSQVNLELQSIVCKIFYGKYRDYTIRLNGNIISIDNTKAVVHDKTHFIEIKEHEFGEIILQYLGSAIQKLQVDNFNSYRLDRSIEFINNYTTNSLTDLYLHHISEAQLEQFVPLKKVKVLRLTPHIEKQNDHIQLNRIFPELQQLHLMMWSHLRYDLINCHFTHLEQFKGRFSLFGPLSNWDAARIDGMLSKNPQIRSVEIENFPGDFVKVIARYLPHLEKLAIQTNFDVNNEVVCLENVWHFELHVGYPKFVSKLSLPRLESLALMDTCYEHDDTYLNQWLEFFANHQNISKLEIFEHYSMILKKSSLIEMLNGLPFLTELRVNTRSCHLTSGEINGIIANHGKLTEIYFRLPAMKKSAIIMLGEHFQSGWHIRDSAENVLWMQRKNSLLE